MSTSCKSLTSIYAGGEIIWLSEDIRCVSSESIELHYSAVNETYDEVRGGFNKDESYQERCRCFL